MKKKMNQLGQKVLSKLLVLLGFSCTFVFMACYGPRPQGYTEDVDENLADSLVVEDSVDTVTSVDEAE